MDILALELGVAVECVERLQATICIAGEDFIDADGTPLFTAAGVEKIRARVDEEMRDTAPPSSPAAPPADHSALRREDLRLTRVFRWSRNLLAETANGNEVVLTVRNNRHLEPGMVLKGCIAGEMGWTYEGRLPRTLGERQLYHPARTPETKGIL